MNDKTDAAARTSLTACGSSPCLLKNSSLAITVAGTVTDIYYNLIEEKSGEFRNKAAAYVLASLYGRRPQGEAIKERNNQQ